MKKVSVILSLILICLTLRFVPLNSFAEEKTNKSGYEYTIIDNKATITGFKGEPTYIEIPETIDGCRVTEIRDNAFYECGSLRHITLPDSIEKIGHHAFYACYSLESITIPDSVSDIGMGCFCGCEALSSVALPDGISRLPESCFRSCTSLKSIDIPSNITAIGDFCFSGCTSLSTVSLSDSVTSLGDCSFYMCESLGAMYIPDSVTELGVCSVGYIPSEEGAVRLDGFTVIGKKKSTAKKYADENNLSFENADDAVHAFVIQRVNGQRVAVPSVFLFIGGAVILGLALSTFRKKRTAKRKRRGAPAGGSR